MAAPKQIPGSDLRLPHRTGPERDDGFPIGDGAFQPVLDGCERSQFGAVDVGGGQPQPEPEPESNDPADDPSLPQSSVRRRRATPGNSWAPPRARRPVLNVRVRVDDPARGDAESPIL